MAGACAALYRASTEFSSANLWSSKRMKVTLKDVAKRAGVSVPTVSLIVNGHDLEFKESTRRAVREALEALNYRPDSMARRSGNRSNRRDAIGLLLRSESSSRVANSPAYECICGVNDVLMENAQFLVMLKLAQLAPADENTPPPRVIGEQFVDGLIVETGLPPALAADVKRYRIPTVWLNTDVHAATDCVYPDELHAGKIATEHLLSLGHRRVLFVTSVGYNNPLAHYSVTERQRGYERAMRAAGAVPVLAHEEILPAEDYGLTSTDVSEAVRQVVQSRTTSQPITAVLTYEYLQALRIRHDLLTAGVSCPEDVSIACAEDLRFLRRTLPEFTGITCDRYQMGRKAAEMMLSKVSQQRPQASQIFRGKLIVGSTTAALKRGAVGVR
jgi:LacI family transcriptional regulator